MPRPREAGRGGAGLAGAGVRGAERRRGARGADAGARERGDLRCRADRPASGMERRAAPGPGPPRPRPRLPPLPLLLLALAARGGCAAPAPRAEDLSLGVVSARPARGVPRPEGTRQCPVSLRERGEPWTHFLGGKLRPGHRLGG